MIAVSIILIIIGIIALCYSIKLDGFISIISLVLCIISIGIAIIFITDDKKNPKEKEIKNVKYYNIKSTIIIEDNIPIDTIYTIYYKKK